MFDLALWLALLLFLVGLTVAEALTDRLPAAPLGAACAAAVAAALWTAEVGDRLAGGVLLAGVGTVLGIFQLLGRRRTGAAVAGVQTRPAAAAWWLEPQAGLAVGLVAGWIASWAVALGWLAICGAVAFYLALTSRTDDLQRLSFLPFLTLSAILVFLLRLVPFV
jgi:hypothetical protein